MSNQIDPECDGHIRMSRHQRCTRGTWGCIRNHDRERAERAEARVAELVGILDTSAERHATLEARIAELEAALMAEADAHALAGRGNEAFRATTWVTAPDVARKRSGPSLSEVPKLKPLNMIEDRSPAQLGEDGDHHPECAWSPGNDEACSCAGRGRPRTSDAPAATVTLPLIPTTDREITCLYCRSSEPCEYAVAVLRPGERALLGIHTACLPNATRTNDARPDIGRICGKRTAYGPGIRGMGPCLLSPGHTNDCIALSANGEAQSAEGPRPQEATNWRCEVCGSDARKCGHLAPVKAGALPARFDVTVQRAIDCLTGAPHDPMAIARELSDLLKGRVPRSDKVQRSPAAEIIKLIDARIDRLNVSQRDPDQDAPTLREIARELGKVADEIGERWPGSDPSPPLDYPLPDLVSAAKALVASWETPHEDHEAVMQLRRAVRALDAPRSDSATTKGEP